MRPTFDHRRADAIPAPVETCRPFADAVDVVRWAHGTFGHDLCITASFGDATLPHLVSSAVPGIRPLAAWTDTHVDIYTERHDLPEHPLADRDYSSIGCWPCTRPALDDDPRSGRWAGTSKTECGLHQ